MPGRMAAKIDRQTSRLRAASATRRAIGRKHRVSPEKHRMHVPLEFGAAHGIHSLEVVVALQPALTSLALGFLHLACRGP